MHNSVRIAIAIAATVIAASPAGATVTVRDTGAFVVDDAGAIDASARTRMESWLSDLERQTTTQVKVLTVSTTEGEDMVGFAQRHFDLWKLGRGGKNNGALIVLAVKDHHVRIHSGYGLESVLPDSWCGSASREAAKKYFKSGAISDGVYMLAAATANRVADAAGVTIGGVPKHRYKGGRRGSGQGSAFLGVPFIVLIIIFASMARRRRHYGCWGGGGLMRGLFWGSVLSNLSGGGRSRWGGGGFGGGGFGGGGSFGGGGMSGGGGGGASW